jgi:hypothetical protein
VGSHRLFAPGPPGAQRLLEGSSANFCHFVGLSHTRFASRALLAGESVDEVAFLLGHRDGNVTRAVYVQEVADARRRTMRRDRMTAEVAGALDAGAGTRKPITLRAEDVRPIRSA